MRSCVTNKMYANEFNAILPCIHEYLETLTSGAPSLMSAAYYVEGLPGYAVMIPKPESTHAW